MATPSGIPIKAYQPVNVYWGCSGYAILIGTAPMNMAWSLARGWFEQNDHYFHLEYFPPYQRFWGTEDCVMIDYGSHAHYLYCIPTK